MSTEEKAISTIKKLALETVCCAKSGHCGSSLDCSSILYAIYHEASISPKNPNFFNRDRIVLSNGHASPALYATLHLFGFEISIDDLKEFRKLGSLTPGHPEIATPGVDCTTGALGQGLANGVGMALCESILSAKYNKPDCKIIDHYTYVVCGDGDLMEGISYESCALAAKWKLNKLIIFYNKNNMTIDGGTSLSTCEDTKNRFLAQGFDVLECKNDLYELIDSIKKAKQNKKPTIIIATTPIAKGTQYQNSKKAHANPFSEKDIIQLNKLWGLSSQPFEVDLDVYKHFKQFERKGEKNYLKWLETLKTYKQKYPKSFKQLFVDNDAKILGSLDINFDSQQLSTIQASHILLQKYAKTNPNFVSCSADLFESTKAFVEHEEFFDSKNKLARNIEFGVREHAMGGIVAGMVLHGGLRASASTFLAFSDYMKYAIRSSAIMDLPVLYLFTHDSIALGEDGQSHQPIEQLESLRLMPNLNVFRPFDANETKFAYMYYATSQTPTVLALSKTVFDAHKHIKQQDVFRGGYVISKEKTKNLNAILVATGSEVGLALRTQKLLEHKGFSVRVVSMPCRELFEKQDTKYKEKVLPTDFPTKVCVEAGVSRCWENLSTNSGVCVGVNTFGESGSSAELYDLFGLSALNIANITVDLINKNKTN